MTDTDTDTAVDLVLDDALASRLTVAALAPVEIRDDDDELRAIGVVLPEGADFRQLDLDRYQTHPRTKQGVARFTDRPSFVSYVQRQDETPNIYADRDDLSFTAVFDDHRGPNPGWRDFRAVCDLQTTPEWRSWAMADRALFDVMEATDQIEQWRHTIAAPAWADVLDLIREFRAYRTANFENVTNDRNGDSTISVRTETTTGTIEVPESLTLVMAPFEGAPTVEIEARFRYRINDTGALRFGVVLAQPADVIRQAFRAEVEALELDLGLDGEDGGFVMFGTPAS